MTTSQRGTIRMAALTAALSEHTGISTETVHATLLAHALELMADGHAFLLAWLTRPNAKRLLSQFNASQGLKVPASLITSLYRR